MVCTYTCAGKVPMHVIFHAMIIWYRVACRVFRWGLSFCGRILLLLLVIIPIGNYQDNRWPEVQAGRH